MKSQYSREEMVTSALRDAWNRFDTTYKTNENNNVSSHICISQLATSGNPIKNINESHHGMDIVTSLQVRLELSHKVITILYIQKPLC